MVEGSTTQEVKLQKYEIVTYQGEYEIYNNALTGQQIIYLKIKTDDGLEGYLRSSTVIAELDENAQVQVVNQESNKTRLATTSRVQDSREEIGVVGEEYVVAIAAGRNSGDDAGIVNEEKGLVEEDLTVEVAERVEELLKTIQFLYRDIKGRRENLSPVFVIGGIYDRKNPFFENRIKVNRNKLEVQILKDIVESDEDIKNNTKIGYIEGIFSNNDEIKENLNTIKVNEFFDGLIRKIEEEC